jgi:predicted transposase/invertase (TIGR01784 family)
MLKDSFVDARCVDAKGRHFVVEMQMYWSQAFLHRMLFNTAQVYVRELEIGKDYNQLRPVYGLAILNDVMDKAHMHYYHRYRMTEETHPEETIEGIDITLIELPLFEPPDADGRKMKDLWISFLTSINKEKAEIPQFLLENSLTAKALELCEIGAYSDAERAGYDKYWLSVWTRAAEIAEGEAKGLAKGLAQGEAEKIRMVRALKARGVDLIIIAETAGLTVQQVEEL